MAYKLILQAIESGISFMINVSLDLDYYYKAKRLYNKNSKVLCTCGLYPSYASLYDGAMKDELVLCIEEGYAVAIGECGLDYYRDYATKDEQIKLFEEQVVLAKDYSLPLIIHARDSYDDVYRVLKRNAPLLSGGVMHCFGGDSIYAKKFMDLGFFISFAGNVTYKNAKAIKESAMFVPLDFLLVETDSPYLSPVPNRGKKNYPWHIKDTALYISKLKGCSFEEISKRTSSNAISLFRLT